MWHRDTPIAIDPDLIQMRTHGNSDCPTRKHAVSMTMYDQKPWLAFMDTVIWIGISICVPGSADKTGYWWIFRTHFLPACHDTASKQSSPVKCLGRIPCSVCMEFKISAPLRTLWEGVRILHYPDAWRENYDDFFRSHSSWVASLTYLPAIADTGSRSNFFEATAAKQSSVKSQVVILRQFPPTLLCARNRFHLCLQSPFLRFAKVHSSTGNVATTK